MNTRAVNLTAIATLGSKVFIGGRTSINNVNLWVNDTDNNSGVSQGWYVYPIFTNIASISSIATSEYNSRKDVFFGGTKIADGTFGTGWVIVFHLDTNQVEDTGFPTIGTAVNAIVSDNQGGAYVGGVTNPTDSVTGPLYGDVWHYSQGAWSNLNLYANDPNLITVVALGYEPVHSRLYAANMYLHNGDIPYAQVRWFDGGSWHNTNLPLPTYSSYMANINAMVVDSSGNIFIGGQDQNYVGAIKKYNSSLGTWTNVLAPTSASINSMAIVGQKLYVSGFDTVNKFGQVWYTKAPFNDNSLFTRCLRIQRVQFVMTWQLLQEWLMVVVTIIVLVVCRIVIISLSLYFRLHQLINVFMAVKLLTA